MGMVTCPDCGHFFSDRRHASCPKCQPSKELETQAPITEASSTQHLILAPGEEILMRGGADKRAMRGLSWIFLVVGILFGLFPLPVFFIYWSSLKRNAWYVTNKRLVQRKAALLPTVETEEIRWDRVGEVRVKKGALLDALFGTVNLVVSDTGINKIELKFIGNSDSVRKLISEQMYADK